MISDYSYERETGYGDIEMRDSQNNALKNRDQFSNSCIFVTVRRAFECVANQKKATEQYFWRFLSMKLSLQVVSSLKV